MCRIASLYCYRGWKEACQATRAISTSGRELSSTFFFPARQGAEGNSRRTETLGEHTPSYATVKNWVAQFKRSDFSTCDAPRPGRPKTVTTPEIIDKIHEPTLKDRRNSAKSISSHVSELGSSFMKIWTFGSSPRNGNRNAWTRIGNVNSTSRLSNFWNFFGAIQMISCRDWWSWAKPGYITMTRRQSNDHWSGGIAAHPAPKIPSAKIRWKNSRLDFLGSRRHPRHWLSSKGPNYQRGVLLISAGAIEGHFEGKTPREVHQGGLVLARQCPGSPATCNPEETGLPGLPMSWSPTLFSGSGPVGLPPVPWTEKKNNWKVAIFHPTRRSLLPRRPCWTDNLLIFFWVACKSYSNELRSVLSFMGSRLNKSWVWSL